MQLRYGEVGSHNTAERLAFADGLAEAVRIIDNTARGNRRPTAEAEPKEESV